MLEGLEESRFVVLWTGAHPIVQTFVHTAIRDHHRAEDLVQEVALICFKKFAQFDPDLCFASWALGIARNQVLAHLRQRYREPLQFNGQALEQILRSCQRLSDEVAGRKQALADCLGRVNERGRLVLEMRYRENKPARVIAKETGLTARAVTVLLYKLRLALKRCVEERLNVSIGVRT